MTMGEWIAVGGVIISMLALAWQAYSLRASFDEADYTELDRLYLEVLRMRVERPDLAPAFDDRANAPGRGSEHDPALDAVARDNYAFIVWNLIETIIDRCEKPGRNFSAWGPIVEYESGCYSHWLQGENLKRFRPGFPQRVQAVIELVRREREGRPN